MKIGVSVRSLSSLGALVALSLGVVTVPSTGAAQVVDPRCPGTSLQSLAAQDACQKAIDLFKYVAPQLGMVLAGGSPTQG